MAELNLFIESQDIQISNDQNIDKQKIKYKNSIYSNHVFFYYNALYLIMTKIRPKQHVISILLFADNTGNGLSYIVLTVKKKKTMFKEQHV